MLYNSQKVLIDFVRRHRIVCVCFTQILNHFLSWERAVKSHGEDDSNFFDPKMLIQSILSFFNSVRCVSSLVCFVISHLLLKVISQSSHLKAEHQVSKIRDHGGREALCVWTLQSNDHFIILPASLGALTHRCPWYWQKCKYGGYETASWRTMSCHTSLLCSPASSLFWWDCTSA